MAATTPGAATTWCSAAPFKAARSSAASHFRSWAVPDDTDVRGRWIPSTSIDQYGATLCSWFGIPDAALATVFPNLANFSTPKLGFLG